MTELVELFIEGRITSFFHHAVAKKALRFTASGKKSDNMEVDGTQTSYNDRHLLSSFIGKIFNQKGSKMATKKIPKKAYLPHLK